ncbi:reverse transcriptase [Tanacetum coccineum]
MDDEEKVRLASIHLYDKALAWHRQFEKINGDVVTWEVYEAAIYKRFGPCYEDPMEEIKNLRQNGTVPEYQDQFKALVRSTHNFVDVQCAKKLGCEIRSICPLQIEVPGRNQMLSTTVCKSFNWNLQGQEFQSDVMLLPLGGCDMVLGFQWLTTLGDTKWNFHTLRIEFTFKGKKITLRGTQQATLQWMNRKDYGRILTNSKVPLAAMSLCVSYHPDEAHIKGFATVSHPLKNLLKKNAFKWNYSAQVAFEQLKQAMIQTPVLALPNFNVEFVVETDASGVGLGVVCNKESTQ